MLGRKIILPVKKDGWGSPMTYVVTAVELPLIAGL